MQNETQKKSHKVTQRINRNKHLDDITKEVSCKMNIAEIKLDDFAEARKTELTKFIAILNNKYCSKAKFQVLPKHMRRRAMSHNPYRIPLGAREASSMMATTKSKCKKHKRKKNNLKISIKRRAVKQNWLETHMYHAKRFKMKKLFGNTIAFKRADKSKKACYKFSKTDSCIYDTSYYNTLLIEGISRDSIKDFLRKHFFYQVNYETSLYNKAIENILVNNEFKIIGPCHILFFSEKTVLLYFHPLMKLEILNIFHLFDDLNVYMSENLNSFLLFGPEAGKRIFKIFKSLQVDDNNSMILNNQDFFTKHLHSMINGEYISFNLKTPKSEFRMNEFIFKKLTDQVLKISAQDLEYEEYNYSSVKDKIFIENKKKSEGVYNSFRNYFKSVKSNTLEKEDKEVKIDKYIEMQTERTNFTHKRKADFPKLKNKIASSMRESSNNQKTTIFMQAKAENNDYLGENKLNSKNCLSNKTETNILLIRQSYIYSKDNLDHPAFLLIFPPSYSSDLFRRFVYLESKPIGLKEFKHYLMDKRNLHFPYDYPSTNSYLKCLKTKVFLNIIKVEERLVKYMRLPPSKRVNYQKLGFPYPFCPSWKNIFNQNTDKYDEINQNCEILVNLNNNPITDFQLQLSKSVNYLVPIYIEGIGSGVPSGRTIVCFPLPKDVENLLKGLKNSDDFMFKMNLNCEENLAMYQEYLNGTDTFQVREPQHTKIIKNKFFNKECDDIINNPDNIDNFIVKKDFSIIIDSRYNEIAKISRDIIGFVTSGGFSFTQGCNVAKGFISVSSLKKLVTHKKKYNHNNLYVLLRNHTKFNYYLAKIEIINL